MEGPTRRRERRRPRAVFGLAVALSFVAPRPATAQADDGQMNAIVLAYNDERYDEAADLASRFLQAYGDATEVGAGSGYAIVSFVLGHARYLLWESAGLETYPGDFHAEVVEPIASSLEILRDDPVHQYAVLGTVYFEALRLQGYRDVELADRAAWSSWRSLQQRYAELRRDGVATDAPRYEEFARHLLAYIERCLETAREVDAPDVFAFRVRTAAAQGFDSEYDDRFRQLHALTFMDGHNFRAAALYQHGLDTMVDPSSEPDAVLDIFREAVELVRSDAVQAEIYRQMGDYAVRLPEGERRVQALEFARAAFGLAPTDADVRELYGSTLHVLSYGAYNQREFERARELALEGLTVDWSSRELSLFDASRAEAAFGNETDAIRHASAAYGEARSRLEPEAQDPFLVNFTNVLRQFGAIGQAEEVERSHQITSGGSDRNVPRPAPAE